MKPVIKYFIYILLILIPIIILICALYINEKKDNCVESIERCKNQPDGTYCSVGGWCDRYGRICGGQSCVGLGLGKCQSGECVYFQSKCNPKNDGKEYLFKICKYIEDNNINVSPADPTKYIIKDVIEGEEYEGKEVFIVWLDCCDTGDSAYFDKETGEIIFFSQGDK